MPSSHPVSDADLIEYAFYGLSAKNGSVVEAHLKTCAQCAERMNRFRAIADGLLVGSFVSPPPALLARARKIFVPAPRRHERWHTLPGNLWRVSRPLLTIGVWLLLILGLVLGSLLVAPGVASAAAESIPGDPIYVLKVAGENVQLLLAPDEAARAQLYSTFAQTRIQEIEKLVARGRYSQIAPTLDAYRNQINASLDAFEQVAQHDPTRADGLEPQLVSTLSKASQVLTALLHQVPAAAASAIELAIRESKSVSNQVQDITPIPNATPPSPGSRPPMTPPGLAHSPVPPAHTPPGQNNTPPGQNNKPPVTPPVPPGQNGKPPGNAGTPPAPKGPPPGHGTSQPNKPPALEHGAKKP